MSEGIWQKKYEELVSRLKVMSVRQSMSDEARYPAEAIDEVQRREVGRQFGAFVMHEPDAYRIDEAKEGRVTHKTYSVVVLTRPNPWELK